MTDQQVSLADRLTGIGCLLTVGLFATSVTTIIYLDKPPYYLLGPFCVMGIVAFLVMKRCQGPFDFDRLRKNPIRRFQVRSNSVVITDNVVRTVKTESAWKEFSVPNGTYSVELKLDTEHSAIAGFCLSGPKGGEFGDVDWAFDCTVSFIHVLDGGAANDRQRIKQICQKLGERLARPIFEELKDADNVVGVVIDRDQGGHRVRTMDGKLICDYHGAEDDLEG